MKLNGDSLIGHDAVRHLMAELFLKKQLHSSLLFVGMEGIGKCLSAVELSRTILCHEQKPGGCSTCHACRLLGAENHPDRFLIECADKDKWNLDSIREVLYSLSLKPFQGNNRVVIFNNAENLSIQACNLLLKTLEEPRSGNFFILVSANQSKLPITVRSRCQVWSFSALTTEELRKIVSRYSTAPSQLSVEEVLSLSDGSVGTARLLFEQAERAADLRTDLNRIFRGDAAYAIERALEWAKDKTNLRTTFMLCRIYARSQLFSASDSSEISRWATFISNLLFAEKAIFDRNINSLLIIQEILLSLTTTDSFTTFANNDNLLEKHSLL